MADITIRQGAHAEISLDVTIDSVAADLTLYSSYSCKIRDRVRGGVQPAVEKFIPGGVITASSITNPGGDADRFEVVFTPAQTATLKITDGYPEDEMPEMAILMTRSSDSVVVAVPDTPLTCAITRTIAN